MTPLRWTLLLGCCVFSLCARGSNLIVHDTVRFGLVLTGINPGSAVYFAPLTIENRSLGNVILTGVAIVNQAGPNSFSVNRYQTPIPDYLDLGPVGELSIPPGRSFSAILQLDASLPGESRGTARVFWRDSASVFDSADVYLSSTAQDSSIFFSTNGNAGTRFICPCSRELMLTPGNCYVALINKSSERLRCDSVTLAGDTGAIHLYYNGVPGKLPPDMAAYSGPSYFYPVFAPPGEGRFVLRVTFHFKDSLGIPKVAVTDVVLNVVGINDQSWTAHGSDNPKETVFGIRDVSVGDCGGDTINPLSLIYCPDSLHCSDTAIVTSRFKGVRESYYTLMGERSPTFSLAPCESKHLPIIYCPLTPQGDSSVDFGYVEDTLELVLHTRHGNDTQLVSLVSRTIQHVLVHEELFPKELALIASPNPFHHSIHFDILDPQVYELEILDVLGREMWVQAHGIRRELSSSDWQPGEDVPSGIYFVRTRSLGSERILAINYLK